MFAAHFVRRCSLPLLVLLVVPVVAAAASAPRELLIRLRRAPARSRLDQITQTQVTAVDALVLQGRSEAVSPFVGLTETFPDMQSVITLRSDSTVNVDSLETLIANDPNVEWVTRNHIYRPNGATDVTSTFVPNDSMYRQEWWLQNISAPAAWEITKGDTSIILGIIDTGIDYLHPDIRPNLWFNQAEAHGLPGVDDDNNGFVDDSIGWDFVDAPSLQSAGDHLVRDSDPFDEMGHGTYVAGIASAASDNHRCFASVGFHCRLMALRAGNAEGFLEEDDIAAALLYAAQMGAQVVNMSFGDTVASPLLRETCRIASDAGVVLVASAGNTPTARIGYPAGFPDVISVGATDQFNRYASFTNYGPSVSVMAPGVSMLSTFPFFTDSTIEHRCGSWISDDGTSFAAPQVTAVAGLMLSVNPNLSPNEVKQIVRSTADDLRLTSLDPDATAGLLNARHAVEQAQHSTNVFARITSPRTDDGVSAAFTARGEAWGATFDEWTLQYGWGEDPDVWYPAATGRWRTYGDSLAQIPVPVMDTILVVRLIAHGTDGSVATDHAHLFVQHEPPRLDSLRVRRMLDYDTYGDLVEVRTNQYALASFLLRNDGGDSVREDFGYVSTEPTAFLSQREHPGAWRAQVQLENAAGMITRSTSYAFDAQTPPFSSNLWARTATSLPNGYLASFVTDYDCDGRSEVWLQPIATGGILHNPLRIYEWNGTDFEATGNTYGIHIPRALGDANQNGLLEMMASFADRTLIWEQSEPCHVFDHVVFDDTTNFIGGAFLDVDSSDGHGEILARVNTANNGQDRPRFVLYSVGANYTLTGRDTLPNLTAGQNGLGQPNVLIGDLDHDGRLDFVYGDYDGDVIFCEVDGGSVHQKWSTRLPLNDATSWLATGDLDGDGTPEFVAGCRSNARAETEDQVRSQHWEYFIFKATGDDQFAALDSVFILGNENVLDHPASVTCADVDGDGVAEILISAFPDFYIVGRDPVSHRFLPRWYDTPSQSTAILARDWNGNGIAEFFYSDGTHFVRGEAASALGNRPLPPAYLSGEPLGPHSILLTWNRVLQAQNYKVYRRDSTSSFAFMVSTAETSTVLTNVPQDVLYTYAVTTVNATFPQPESVYSTFVTLTANELPTVEDTAAFSAPHYVRVRFSEAMGPTSLYQWSYHLQDGRMPAVISSGAGGREIHLAFDGEFAPGWYHLTLNGLRDAQGARLPLSENNVWFEVTPPAATPPHIASHRLLGGPAVTAVEILFTETMSASALDPANYRMDAPHRVISVERATAESYGVIVHLDPHAPVGALGREAWLYVRNLYSQNGIALDTTEAANLNLVAPSESVDDAYVYPNPFKGIGPDGGRSVFFAGLPELATIRIFTLQGIHIRTLDHRNLMGAERWDLATEKGDQVAGGVYLYTIESDGKTVRGKVAVLR